MAKTVPDVIYEEKVDEVYPKMQTGHPERIINGRPDCEKKATVVIVEKRPLIRDLLSSCVARATDLKVAAAMSIDDYVESAQADDVVLVVASIAGDPESPENKEFIQRIIESMNNVPTVVVSDGEDLHQIMALLQAGTRGYISTSMPFDLAMSAIRLVQAGGQFVPAASVLGLGPPDRLAPVRGRRSPLLDIFTTRQAAVVEALRQGKANKTIAHELNMRESTVKVHVRNIMKKLKATNRTEVAYIVSNLIGGVPLPRVASDR